MDHELHSTRLIEEAFEDESILRRQASKSALRGAQIVEQLLGSRAGESKILHQPPQRAFTLRIEPESLLNFCSEARDGTGKLITTTRSLAEPERNGRWSAVSVFHADDASLDA